MIVVLTKKISNISAIWWREQVALDYTIMMSTLYLTIKISWIFIVLPHWNNNPWADMSLLADTLSWFLINQSVLFDFTRPGLEHMIAQRLKPLRNVLVYVLVTIAQRKFDSIVDNCAIWLCGIRFDCSIY